MVFVEFKSQEPSATWWTVSREIEFRSLIEQVQWLTIIPKMHARIASRWAETAVMAGVLQARREGYRWRYIVPANEPIDPIKDVEATSRLSVPDT